MSEKIWAQENHDLALAGPDTPKQEWESSGAYNDVLGPAYYDPEPDPRPDPWPMEHEHDPELEAGA